MDCFKYFETTLFVLIFAVIFIKDVGIEAKCGDTTALGSKGTIFSPKYPFKYSHDITQCWSIFSSGNLITVTVSSLNLESCTGCSCDSIEIFDGSSESSRSLGKFCSGSFKLTSSGSHLFIKFVSDKANNGDPFKISYDGEHTAKCGDTTALGSKGTIFSPKYPFKYSNDITKCWRISSSGNVITVTASSLNLESCTRCSCDSIEIFDGSSESSRSLGKFCSGSFRLISSGSHLFIKFVSDKTNNGNPFKISYEGNTVGSSGKLKTKEIVAIVIPVALFIILLLAVGSLCYFCRDECC